MADEEKKPFLDKEGLRKGADFFWNRRIEFISGALMLAGIILSFFYIHIGGALVGLAFGICFFNEIYTYFVQLRDLYTEQGLFKTIMSIATVLYFLISIPAFILAAAIGFAAMYLIRHLQKK